MYSQVPKYERYSQWEGQHLTAAVPCSITGKGFGIFSLLHAVLAVLKVWLYNAEDHGEILLIRHLNPAILIRVIASEYVCQPLQDDAALDEVIKCDLPSSLPVKFSDEDVMELIREPVAKT